MTKIILEGVLREIDRNAKDPCAGGPNWTTYVGDVPIGGRIRTGTILEPFIGKRIRLTVEVLNDEL